MSREWVIQFWDFDQWDTYATGPFKHKQQAIDRCQELNRQGPYGSRGGFEWQEGHRFRVRSARK